MIGPGPILAATPLAQALAAAAVAAFALAAAIIVRRAAQLLAETREAEAFRRRARDLTARVEAALEAVSGRIDGVRRQSIPPDEIAADLTTAAEAVATLMAEARELKSPAPAVDIREGMVGELERAARALEMVEHGCSILTSARVGSRGLEAQTAIKRGYLNVLHAREAVGRLAARAAAYGGDRPRGWLFERRA